MKKYICLALLALVTVAPGCAHYNRIFGQRVENKTRTMVPPYSVVIDAGSSGSRVYIYKYNGLKNDVPQFEAVKIDAALTSKVSPGIATLANTSIKQIKDHLDPLLASVRASIPSGINLASVPIFLGATAGVRNLLEADRISLMKWAKSALSSSSMLVQGAEAISGQYEGFFTWATANYWKRTLGGSPGKTVGIIEMGGASLQLTFVPQELPSSAPIKIGGTAYALYSYSYNHLGINESKKFRTQNDCTNGSGNFKACKAAINRFLDADAYCAPNCGVAGNFQPPLRGNFLLIGGLPGDLASGCGFISSPLVPNNLDSAGERLCNIPNQATLVCPKAPEDFIKGYCFGFALISSLLSGGEGGVSSSKYDALGFAKNATNIRAVANIDGYEATWTLGYLILNATGNYVSPDF